MNEPISGYYLRLNWLKTELYKDVERCNNNEELLSCVAWYMSYGFAIGMKKDDLISNLNTDPRLLNTAQSLSEEDILRGRKPPAFRHGDIVEVIVNAKNLTHHKGVIYDMRWHGDRKEWYYFILEDGKKVSKRYFYDDLKLIDSKANE